MNVHVATPQSTFVTVLAWVLIVFNAMGVFGAIMQNVMINFFMPSMLPAVPGQPGTAFPLTVFRVFALVFLGFAGFITYAGYGLLRRRNWARRTFIVVFGLGIAGCVLWFVGIGIALALGGLAGSGRTPMPAEMRGTFVAMMVMFGIFAVAWCVLLGWLIKRLRSPSVKSEFIRTDPVGR